MAETCNTSSESTTDVCIDESHLSSLVEVLIVHVVDEVQCLDINSSKPLHHIHEARHELFVCQNVAFYWTVSRTALLASLRVYTTADSISETLSEVGTSTEELHLLTSLSSRNAAADAVVVAPDRTHHVVVLILNRACLNANPSSETLEVFRQTLAIEHGEVWLW